ncbi:phosphotransferase [Actinoplanes regularis]|uniref:Phosphotransferase enzyme family protein n=1 Tax=Actinoplanes regularis TaxID=52697 RepID=A0A239F0X9_9ACTN|nr:phosphotransferase [Actinoplanes regularis]GIE89899.1 phosphotransferase [Actinoplanes regularis]SNS50188.1 Phosphotransferase enzyme family protein [Actinoplanes regularis]
MTIVDEPVADTGGFDALTPWAEPGWRAEALSWAEERLRAAGHEPAGRSAVRVRLRPWSVVAGIPVEGGATVWFKANAPASAFESALAGALPAWVPGQVLHPIAIDAERGWTLFADGGGSIADAAPGPDAWVAPLQQYAELQRTLAARVDALLELGVPDRRPQLLAGGMGMLLARAGGVDDAVHDAIGGLGARYAGWCAELAASGVPVTLDHGDLQDGQVFTRGGGRYVFHDWDAASVAFPFASLVVTARVVRDRFGADGPAVLARLRDAYLEPWTADGHTRVQLTRLAGLACRVAPIGQVFRALAPGRMFPGSPMDTRAVHSVAAQQAIVAACGLLVD